MRIVIENLLIINNKLPNRIDGVQSLNHHFKHLCFRIKFYLLMPKNIKASTNAIVKFNEDEFRSYIFMLQDYLQKKLGEGLSIDQILDIEDPFESLEPILPEEVYPIMVLAMINNIRSDTVMDALTEGFYKGVKRYMKEENG
tara:strand:- start:500 stop:925 length:426 start_codon:yes stop_codon:yes gene_type:complete